ncbi:Rrf2 family transcriptional regulator [Actinacidiphila glaucinigra]|uniref:Transcriptional regulator, BadM/Rrf2 family n=1 Tax=Actinacidiphila glaucinigra TaxID=235986 RepID=A0A239M778_9ACTN|nr:Rrf2 family transcriptional regulator [Actinacidiphila glaucinigra]SNT37699.1 transcriptional regulator, BadM/Rrf2 family [Actinacidiphila glaucinigra]
MSANSRLTIAVHVLTWMALDRRDDGPAATSERIAGSVNTNAVVIRRCLGDLRRAGLVESRRGAGAGWSLVREPAAITLLDVYGAVEEGTLFRLHPAAPNADCPVGHGIGPALRQVYDGLRHGVERELAATTIADVLRDTLARRR